MKVTLIWYPKCSTCQKAKKYLESKGIEVETRDIVTDTPTIEELKLYLAKSSLPLAKFYNTSGKLYKEYNIKEKRLSMSEEEQLQLLSENGMLIKRPILLVGETVIVGFQKDAYDTL